MQPGVTFTKNSAGVVEKAVSCYLSYLCFLSEPETLGLGNEAPVCIVPDQDEQTSMP